MEVTVPNLDDNASLALSGYEGQPNPDAIDNNDGFVVIGDGFV
jgi:hypothetical protein